MLGGADNPNGELLSYIIGADTQRCPLPRARCSISSISNEMFNLDSLQK